MRPRPKRPREPEPSSLAPRPRDAGQTRAAILAAARQAFATQGYARAGMRDIAAAAGITPALVVRYFGGKRELFVAAIEPDIGLGALFGGERAAVGRSLARHFFGKPRPEADTLSILLLAAGDPEIRELATEMLEARVIRPLARWLGPPRAEARASLLLATIAGVWMFRQVLPMRGFSSGPDGALVATLADAVQRIVDAGDGV